MSVKLNRKRKLFVIFLVIIICLSFVSCKNSNYDDDDNNNKTSEIPTVPLMMNNNSPIHPESEINGTEQYYDNEYLISNPDDYICIVNKKYNLSNEYEPSDLVKISIPFAEGRTDDVKWLRKDAELALEKLYESAKNSGYEIYAASGYRSYNIQKSLFINKITEKGSIEAANEYSALPGQSEHQLGLAIDLALKSQNYKLNSDFGETEEGRWLMENAYKFGFILRYPENKSDITGYMYEPWHYRYVGKKLSKYLFENDLTLEEYYQAD